MRPLTGRQGQFVIVKDLAVIMPGTVLPEGTVVPSLTVWSGNPGRFAFTRVIHLRTTYLPFPTLAE